MYYWDYGYEDSMNITPIYLVDFGDEDKEIVVSPMIISFYSSPSLPIGIKNSIGRGTDSGGIDPPELTLKIAA